jgi:hypothetical protein
MMNELKKITQAHEAYIRHGAKINSNLLRKAERSGVPQGCLPSATGSSDARAADESGSDSSVIRLTEAVLIARALEWEAFAEQVKRICQIEPIHGDQYAEVMYAWYLLGAHEVIRLTSESNQALTAQRERASQTNNRI